MRRLLVVASLALVVGCAEYEPARAVADLPTPEVPTVEVLGGLTITLQVDDPRVEPGAGVAARLVVENRSDHAVVDPACVLANTGAGIIPRDQPDAELWLVTVTDCGGAHTYEPGFVDSYGDEIDNQMFVARTMYGEPLPPGEYFAGLEIDGARMLVAVSVADEP